jgi:ElaB/YqjD/DUF883 family membrane-anchored ribosome-binding protein
MEHMTMEATISENGRTGRVDTKTLKNDALELGHQWRSATGQEVSDLMADVQDLLGRVAHSADPEIARLRAKVEGAMASAKTALSDGRNSVQRHAREAVHAGDTYVREQPWQSVGIAAAAGLLVGFLIARR